MTGVAGVIGKSGAYVPFMQIPMSPPRTPNSENPVADHTHYSGEVFSSGARFLGKHLQPPMGPKSGWCPTACCWSHVGALTWGRGA